MAIRTVARICSVEEPLIGSGKTKHSDWYSVLDVSASLGAIVRTVTPAPCQIQPAAQASAIKKAYHQLAKAPSNHPRLTSSALGF